MSGFPGISSSVVTRPGWTVGGVEDSTLHKRDNFVADIYTDIFSFLYKIEAVCLCPNSKPNPESAAAPRRDGTLILLVSGQHRFDRKIQILLIFH